MKSGRIYLPIEAASDQIFELFFLVFREKRGTNSAAFILHHRISILSFYIVLGCFRI